MDREYYYRKEAREQQAALAKERATQHLLRAGQVPPVPARKGTRLTLRTVPVAVLVAFVKLFHLAA